MGCSIWCPLKRYILKLRRPYPHIHQAKWEELNALRSVEESEEGDVLDPWMEVDTSSKER